MENSPVGTVSVAELRRVVRPGGFHSMPILCGRIITFHSAIELELIACRSLQRLGRALHHPDRVHLDVRVR